MITSLVTLGFAVSLLALSIVAYLLPVLIGWSRHVHDLAAVVVINIALGWTLVGWVIALAMALRTRPEPVPTVQVYQGVPPLGTGPVPPAAAAPWDSGAPPLPPPDRGGPRGGEVPP